MNPLIKWLFSCDKVITREQVERVCTHFMLDGGKLDLSSDFDIFQQIYSKNMHHKNCIVELKTNIFKLFIDFDVLTTEDIEINKYVSEIQKIISDIYFTDQRCIVTTADKDKKIIRNDVEYIKKGFHFHWPSILVDKSTALKIRDIIIIKFTTIFGKIPEFYENWEKIIDKSVYNHNGIRMLGADKCSISDGIQNYENRVYVVHSVYIGKNIDLLMTGEYKTDTLKSVKETSIRSFETDITKHGQLPEFLYQEDSLEDKSGFDNIKCDSDVYIAIKKFFINYASGYKIEDIRKIIKMKDKEIYIIESKSKFCQNIDDYHSNNHIFFKLTPFGFCQRCRSERYGKFGCCREYASGLIPISITLQKALKWDPPKNKIIKTANKVTTTTILEKLENNITGKPKFSGPCKQLKNK